MTPKQTRSQGYVSDMNLNSVDDTQIEDHGQKTFLHMYVLMEKLCVVVNVLQTILFAEKKDFYLRR